MVSKRVLVMTYIEGVPFTKLVIPTGFSKKLFASQGRKMLNILADAWGHMLFDAGVFNAVSTCRDYTYYHCALYC
jgi:predicted unusual protein kinase regulating ubiquinone biosynthesis (AarF/ABC1/UbiB family)